MHCQVEVQLRGKIEVQSISSRLVFERCEADPDVRERNLLFRLAY